MMHCVVPWRQLSFITLIVTEGCDRRQQAQACIQASYMHVFVTGGCGNMYEVHIQAEEFCDMRTVVQHRMVNEVEYKCQ